MKIFFSMSFRGNLSAGRKIYQAIKKLGHVHTSKCFEENTPEKFYQFTEAERATHYERIFSELSAADLIVVETTLPSLTIGQIIQEGIDQKIPVLALCEKDKHPFFLDGIEKREPRLLVMEYLPNDLNSVIKEGLDYLSETTSSRFTLIFPRSIMSHLKKITETGISRSEYIRKLIRRDMKRKRK